MACSDGSYKHDKGLSQPTEHPENFGALNPKKQLKIMEFLQFCGLRYCRKKDGPIQDQEWL
jgi:hypothetical protein